MSFLQGLLPELLDVIASYLDQASLAAMVCSCKRINACCTPVLYKDIVLDDVGCVDIKRSFEHNHGLVHHIRSITFDNGQNYVDHFADFILPEVRGVQHLRYFSREQGFFDRGLDEDENALGLGLWWPGPDQRVPRSVRVAAQSLNTWLTSLKTCTLEFFHSRPLWDLERKALLFLHPTLASLDIHHAYHESDIEDPPHEDLDTAVDYWRSPIFDADPGPASTNLKVLRLHLCEIHPAALGKILSFPRDLEHFTFTYYQYMDYEQKQTPPRLDLVLEALKQQQCSLKSLNVHGHGMASSRAHLGSFLRLDSLDINLDMWFAGIWNENTSTSAQNRKPLYELDGFFPPNLKQLTLRYQRVEEHLSRNAQRFETLDRILSDQTRLLPSLQRLLLIEERLVSATPSPLQPDNKKTEKQLDTIMEQFRSNTVDVVHEVWLVEADPYSPRLRDMMGRMGNKHYRAGTEGGQSPVTQALVSAS